MINSFYINYSKIIIIYSVFIKGKQTLFAPNNIEVLITVDIIKALWTC